MDISYLYRQHGKLMFSEASVCSQGSLFPKGTLPLGDLPSPPHCWHLVAATAVVSTYPTGMHSCFLFLSPLFSFVLTFFCSVWKSLKKFLDVSDQHVLLKHTNTWPKVYDFHRKHSTIRPSLINAWYGNSRQFVSRHRLSME